MTALVASLGFVPMMLAEACAPRCSDRSPRRSDTGRSSKIVAMYAIDERDWVVALDDLPRPSIGAPCPLVMQDELTAVVAYYVEAGGRDRRGEWVGVVDPESSAERAALVRFRGVGAAMLGPPNDEAFHGHPLAARGLAPYSAAEVHDSSWIRSLERMNSVHPHHRPEPYGQLRHFVLAFHDSTLECVANTYDFALVTGPVDGLAAEMLRLVRGGSR